MSQFQLANDAELDTVEGGRWADRVADGASIALVGAALIGGPFGLAFAAGALAATAIYA